MRQQMLVISLALFACSCGGGGGGTAPPVPPPPPPPVTQLNITTANALNAGIIGLGLTEASVQLALATINPLIDLLEDDLLTLNTSCGGGGNVESSVVDRDASSLLSQGDAVTTTWSGGCFSGELNATASGTISVEVIEYWKGISGELFVTLDVSTSGFSVVATESVDVTGSFTLDLVMRHSAIELIRTQILGNQSLALQFSGNLEVVSETVIRRALTRTPGSSDRPYEVTATLNVSSDILDGDMSCASTRVLASPNPNHEPLSGEFRCTAAGNGIVRIDSDRPNRDTEVAVSVDETGNGSFVTVLADLNNPVYWFDLVEGGLFTERVRIPASGGVVQVDLVTPTSVTQAINDMEYADAANLIYATTDTDVLEIDPDTLQVLRNLPIAGTPGAIGLSDDESVAYIALDALSMIQKIDLGSLSAAESFPLGDSYIAGFGPRDAFRIRVAPGSNDLVVVSTPNAVEMVAYSSGVELANTINDTDSTFSPPRSFYFRSATEIVAQDTSSTAYSVFLLTLDPTQGLSVVSDTPFLSDQSRNRIKRGSQYTFASSGAVFDVDNQSLVTNLKPPAYFYDDLDVDPDTGVVVAMSSTSTQQSIDVFDESSFQLTGQYRLPVTGANGRFEPLLLTANSLLYMRDDEMHRIDRSLLVQNQAAAGCVRLDLSTLLVPGTYITLNCNFTSLTYDGNRGRIYATVPTGGANGNSIAVLDATSMTVESYIPLSGRPGAIAVSNDSSTLFVAIENANRYLEIDLTTLAVTREVSLGIAANGPYIANSLAATSSAEGEIVVSMNNDVGLFSDGALVGSVATPNRSYDQIWTTPDGNTAYARDFSSLDQLQISGGGVNSVQSFASAIFPRPAGARDNTLFGTDGRFFDMAGNAILVGCSALAITGDPDTRVGPEGGSDDVFYARIDYRIAGGNFVEITSCNAATLAEGPMASTYIFATGGPDDVIDVVPVGGDQIAVLTNQRLILLDRP